MATKKGTDSKKATKKIVAGKQAAAQEAATSRAKGKPGLFEIGATVHVFKATGVRRGSRGVQTSERIGLEFPDIGVAEALRVVERVGSGLALCERGDASRKGKPDERVVVHINHIDPSRGYNVRKASAVADDARAKAERAEARTKGSTPTGAAPGGTKAEEPRPAGAVEGPEAKATRGKATRLRKAAKK